MPSKSGGPSAVAADTKTALIDAYTVPQDGTVRQIRIGAYNGVADKAGTAIVTFESDQQKGPFEFAVVLGHGLTDVYPLKESVIVPAMHLSKGEIITISLTSAEALEEVVVSIEWA